MTLAVDPVKFALDSVKDELRFIVCITSLQKVLLSLRTYDIPSVTKTSVFEPNVRGCLPTVGDIEVTAVPLLSAEPDVPYYKVL